MFKRLFLILTTFLIFLCFTVYAAPMPVPFNKIMHPIYNYTEVIITKTFNNPDEIPSLLPYQGYILRKYGDTVKKEKTVNKQIKIEKVYEDIKEIPDEIIVNYEGQQVKLVKKGHYTKKIMPEIILKNRNYQEKNITYYIQTYVGQVRLSQFIYEQKYKGYIKTITVLPY